MKQASLPETPHEKALEIAMLNLIMTATAYGASLKEILNVVERIRFTTTELALEAQKHGA